MSPISPSLGRPLIITMIIYRTVMRFTKNPILLVNFIFARINQMSLKDRLITSMDYSYIYQNQSDGHNLIDATRKITYISSYRHY
jgi:hypothetical protein